MQAKESAAASTFDLPDELLEVLPSDPYEQLDLARRITSIALSTRVSALESDSADLRAQLSKKDDLIADLQSQVESLDASLADAVDRLSRAEQEKERLLSENQSLSDAVKKLNRDVSKLEIFKKTLMQSLQEDEETPAKPTHIIAKPTPAEDDSPLPPLRTSSIISNTSEVGNSLVDDQDTEAPPKSGVPHGLLLASTRTPRLTPPGSPPSYSATASPTNTSKPASPRRHAMSFSTSRGMNDGRSSMFSSLPPSSYGSMTGSDNSGRARVDGKEFFRQVRSRLSYEQFGAFLANVKELNSHKQTKEETLRKAEEIFGPVNKDLYTIFEGLITRNVH
ncbi:hypothetical protein SAY86_013260 [Trapa natans]|uniref:At4g15545-like C-terminal domain-containing protein n=1 Tax=Trapa natans TaxID=22666 RepID=A0AAN7LY15_TRANT|nr:hypothetical protein SAY86_013260 [Trapa natans]